VIRLQLATHNANKMREFRELLGPEFALEDLISHPEIVEDGATFLENARIKALALARVWPGLVVADDSGLEVDSLGGAPGVRSARYAGEKATDAENRQKLLAALAASPVSRRARFRCVLVLAQAGKVRASFEGSIEGKIVVTERGAAGFGYDPIFQPVGFEKTFAEMSAAEKNALSHRGAAVAQLREYLLKAAHLQE
jgi:XTP/dITP diphosphohydrolase